MAEEASIQKIAAGQQLVAADGAEYAEAVRGCAAEGRKVVDYGTVCRGLGHAPPADHVRIRPPSGVVEHQVSDFTVTVAGGTPLAEVQAALGERGQFLPIDGVGPTATVAEVIAHNLYGPLRLGYGAMRELLLGLRIVDGTGRLLRVGGRTMKNVAGYDVTRLMVGNLNTLGLIAEATLRTAALPDEVTSVRLAELTPWELDDRMTSLLSGDAMPIYLAGQTTVQCAEAGRHVEHELHLGYAGSKAGREAQHAALERWLSEHLFVTEPQRTEAAFAEDERQRRAQLAWQETAGAWVKVIVPPAHTGQVVGRLLEWIDTAAQVQTQPAWGVVHVGAELDAEAARSLDRRLLDMLQEIGGLRAWMRRPAEAGDIEPFGPPQPEWTVLKRLGGVFDPRDVINPGRLG